MIKRYLKFFLIFLITETVKIKVYSQPKDKNKMITIAQKKVTVDMAQFTTIMF